MREHQATHLRLLPDEGVLVFLTGNLTLRDPLRNDDHGMLIAGVYGFGHDTTLKQEEGPGQDWFALNPPWLGTLAALLR